MKYMQTLFESTFIYDRTSVFLLFCVFHFDTVQKASKNLIQPESYYSRTELVMAHKICSTIQPVVLLKNEKVVFDFHSTGWPIFFALNHASQRAIALNNPASLLKASFCLSSYSEETYWVMLWKNNQRSKYLASEGRLHFKSSELQLERPFRRHNDSPSQMY